VLRTAAASCDPVAGDDSEGEFVRFVIAIVAFAAAAVMIVCGIGQRTVWRPATSITASTTVRGGEPYTVIEGSVLLAHEGQQTLTVGGGGKAFVAYGRTSDVLAWIGQSKYAKVSYDPATNTLSSKVITPAKSKTPSPSPTASDSSGSKTTGSGTKVTDPKGSDLWLEQFNGSSASVTKTNVPDSVSAIVASNGTKPAPDKISLSWPLDGSTPWAGPLITGGMLLALIGLIMLLLGLRHMRGTRGPRRGGGRRQRLPRGARRAAITGVGAPASLPPTVPENEVGDTPERDAVDAAAVPSGAVEAGTAQGDEPGKDDSQEEGTVHSRPTPRSAARRTRRLLVPLVLAGSLALTGCSAQYWPHVGATKTPTPTSTPIATDVPGQGKNAAPPAVTTQQLDTIVANISATAAKADSGLDSTLAATRFSGPALDAREGNYALRQKSPTAAAEPAIPTHVALALPEATDEWPRVVSVVVSDPKNPKAAPLDLVLVQQSPRANYTVEYAIELEANAKVPDVPPSTLGTSVVPLDSKLLLVQPGNLASYYEDVLMNGEKSKYFDLFDESGDKLSSQVGAAYKAAQLADIAQNYATTASLTYSSQAASGSPVAMATNDSGAVVATATVETSTLKPIQAGATVQVKDNPNVQALTGVTDSTKGIETTYGYQLLFYVPPAASGQKVQLLGYTQTLLSAKEL
jgi:hypothetical protein